MPRQMKKPTGWLGKIIYILVGILLGILADRVILAGVIPASLVPASAVGDFRLMAEVWNLIDAHFVDRKAIRPSRMTNACLTGMVNSLGDTGHTVFLTPAEVKMDHASLQGHFAGIGAEVEMRKGHVVIVTPIDGTPAAKAHLRPGDSIVAVNKHPVTGMSLIKVVQLIRGKVGTPVTLTIKEMHHRKERTLTLMRAEIPLISVHWKMIPGTKIADIRISRFSEGTAKELFKALARARQKGAKGMILDLRYDPGGLLYEAIDVASMLIPSGNVLLEKNAQGKIKPIPVLQKVPKFHFPLAVLINKGTASAAEIVSGALHDDLHAPLIGTRTFGTGTVLRQFMLSNGAAVLLAVREWLTPDGRTIWHTGIKPTEMVKLKPGVMPVVPQILSSLSNKKIFHGKDKQFLAALRAVEKQVHKRDARVVHQLTALNR